MANCEEMIDKEFESTTEILKKLWSDYQNDTRVYFEEIGQFDEYGLCFDRTKDQDGVPYYRYHLSWGGPEEEIRFYANDGHLYHVEYWYKNWCDGARIEIGPNHPERAFYEELWNDYFSEISTSFNTEREE